MNAAVPSPGSAPGRMRSLLNARWRQLALLAVLAGLLSFLAMQSAGLRLLDNRIFDYLSTLAPPAPSGDGPIIVAIDEPSMAEIGRQWPWPRDLHARLVDSLRAAGAAAIGLDIVFAEPSTPEADGALAASLGPDVVLAGDETVVEAAQGDQLIRVEPLAELTAGGALVGIAGMPLDMDGVFRRLPAREDSFVSMLLRAAGREIDLPADGAMIQAFGPARTIPTVSYYQALDPAAFLPPDIFRGRVVIVGLSTQSAPTIDAGGADMHATPFTVRTGRLVAGAEVHATILENLSRHLSILPASMLVEVAAIMIAALWGVAIAWRRTGAATAMGALLGVFLLFGAAYLLLRFQLFYVSPGGPALALLLVASGQAGLDFARERRLRAGIVRAFSQYLSPVLVERLAERPEALNLGGERRELTVLFCDVRGFTTIAESLKDDPERLTTLMNRLITPLTEAVLAENGTVDKYIGDCVMAFWNAPLDTPDHAARAVRCALAMLEAIDRLNAELSQESRQDDTAPVVLRIGIGVNTGECVVGNMGSSMRFAYTAMGDPVNLASRLESESKAMRVPLLIGEETVRRALGAFAFVPLHKILVKGKWEPVRPFTVLRGEAMSAEEAARHKSIVDAIDEPGSKGASAKNVAGSLRRELRDYYDTHAGDVVSAPT